MRGCLVRYCLAADFDGVLCNRQFLFRLFTRVGGLIGFLSPAFSSLSCAYDAIGQSAMATNSNIPSWDNLFMQFSRKRILDRPSRVTILAAKGV